ncbi:5'/3'-nucleotidase SurE [Ferroacidibacillus organovorans]|uniref:5'-nucleotidase SurE n=1 Tax=Ferroacidibacillus organovorans TaxID=1765683 RepID=A0A1V4EUL0_9BACL|nr:5'/3'-nucleotidase SurE [Ferroacidibacillus organovorans]OPG16520.1 5'/3'-nucleotidase SurE [Ferroacidibacillus organovorans]
MHLLITNDDGIYAKGIRALAIALAQTQRHRVTVVAPDRQQSASSHSITLHKPLHAKSVALPHGIEGYAVNGTPADCVKLALGALCDEHPPDLVVSGVNHGANLGMDIVYSGTASAASEAVMHGIPAIAMSLIDEPFDFTASVHIALGLIDLFNYHKLPHDVYLNVNIPPGSRESLKGIRVTKTGIRKYRNAYEKRVDPLGRTYYWQAGQVVQIENEPDTDVYQVERGYVSVTPVHLHFTNSEMVDTLKSWPFQL